MKCPILMAYALISKNYFGNLFQWRNAAAIVVFPPLSAIAA